MDYTNNRPSYSRFASLDEIKKSLYRTVFDDKSSFHGGIPLYADSEAVYVEHDDSHSLIIGSTGSKKTRLIGMPALQIYANAGESFIATDPKAELYKKTFPLLKKYDYHIFVLNLRDPLYSDSWNPLKIPYRQYQEGQKDKSIELVTDMANCISKSNLAKDPYWDNSAADLLAGLILILFEHANENEIHFKSLRALRRQAFKIEERGVPYIQDNFLKNLNKSSFLGTLLSGTAEVTEETRSCILSVFDQAMRPFFCQDNLIDMLSGNNLDMGGIGKEKTAVFLIIPDENTLYNKLISVFVKQCYSELLREAVKHTNNRLPVRVNFLLDEFSSLPTITDFPAMITASRSRNIRFNLFVQSQTQLVERYGYHAETIKGNCENWVFLHSRELSILSEIVDLSGNKNPDEPLVSALTLQTLDKEKGEAFVLNKRLYPYISSLWDIDKYPNIVTGEQDVTYPENICKANAVFDFAHYCQNQIPVETYLGNDEVITEPLSTNKKNENEPLDTKDNEKEERESDSVVNQLLANYVGGVGRGWYGLVLPIIEEIKIYNEKKPVNDIRIDQIKEKYGTLRLYTSWSPNYIEGMITKAEKESKHICEFCGARGKLVKINGWWKTLCVHHKKARKEANLDQELTKYLYREAMQKYIRSLWHRSNEFKVIKMVSYEEGEKFLNCSEQENFQNFWDFVKRYIVKNNIKMTGCEHQYYGVPLIEYGGKTYAFSLSYAKWGRLMAEAFEPENKDEMAYCKWAWSRPDGEKSWENPDIE
jgi:type IV secretion system protein VirD4